MTNKICGICEENVTSQFLKCAGLYCSIFHVPCLANKNKAYKQATVNAVKNIGNYRWYCDVCIDHPIVADISYINVIVSRLFDIKGIINPLLTNLDPTHATDSNKIVDKNDDIDSPSDQAAETVNVSEHSDSDNGMEYQDSDGQQKQQQNLNNSHSSGSTSTPMQANIFVNSSSRRKRHLIDSLAISSPPKKQAKSNDSPHEPVSLVNLVAKKPAIVLANLVAQKPSVAPVEITTKTNMMRSIYISPFDPTVESAEIMDYLESIEDFRYVAKGIKCTKLVSENRKNRLTFTSFKLDVPRHHFNLIMDPAIWKINGKDEIIVTEFVAKRIDNLQNMAHKPKQNQNSKNVSGNNKHRKKEQQQQQHRQSGDSRLNRTQHFQRNQTGSNQTQQSQPSQGWYNPFRRQEMSHNQTNQPIHRCHCQSHCAENRFGRQTNNRRY